MPADKAKTDKVIAEIATDAYLLSQGQPVLSTVATTGGSLAFFTDPEAGMIAEGDLKDFTKDCFGRQNKIVNPALVRSWLTQCAGVPGVSSNNLRTCKQMKDFIAGSLTNMGAFAETKGLGEQLATAGKRMASWGCETVDQVGAVVDFAARLAANQKKANSVDSTEKSKAIQMIANIAQLDGVQKPNLYEVCNRLNDIWLSSEKALNKVLNGAKTLSEAEAITGESRRNDEMLTEIARCANELRKNNDAQPKVNGKDLLIQRGSTTANIEEMAQETGTRLFGLTDGMTKDRRILNPEVIKDGAGAAPAGKLGNSPAEEDQGRSLAGYVENAMKSIHALGAAKLPDRLANSYDLKNRCNCETITQASQVVDYADQLTQEAADSKDKKFKSSFKDLSAALNTFTEVMKNSGLGSGSQFEMVTELNRLDRFKNSEFVLGKASEEVLLGRKTLGQELDGIPEGPDKEFERER